MYTAQFTEFSYGYAMTDNILHSGFPHSGAAPVFPSLLSEGTQGGFDVKIPLRPVPFFLQFKIPQIVHRSSDKMPKTFCAPYLRMHLRTKQPNQHQLLLDWETAGHLVFYATPDFSQNGDLDKHFSNGRVHFESWYVRPCDIGVLDDKPHCLAYMQGQNEFWLCSQLRKLPGRFSAETLDERLGAAVRHARRREALQFLQELASNIAEVTRTRIPQLRLPLSEEPRPQAAPDVSKEGAAEQAERRQAANRAKIRNAARQVAYLVQARLGCVLAITGTDS